MTALKSFLLIGFGSGVLAAQLAPGIAVVVLGPPGSGKTVQAAALSKRYGVPVVSMAGLLKKEIGKKGPHAKALASAVASGELVNDDAANELVKVRILQPDASRGFVLDGYPASAGQALVLRAFLEEKGLKPPFVVVLDVSDNVARQRMLSRKRADDEALNIDRRLREYHEQASMLLETYGAERLLKVDAGAPVAAVTREVLRKVEQAGEKTDFATREPDRTLKVRPKQ